MRLYIIIGLGVLSAVLLVLVIVFAVKSRNAGYEYYDDEDDEEPEDDDDEDDSWEEKGRKKGGFFSRRKAEEDDEEDDFDDFLAAVNKKRTGGADFGTEEENEGEAEPEEKVDLTLTANLPEIDMSAVEEVEKKAEKTPGKTEKAQKEDDGDEDFDIEIFDIDDLNL